MPTILTVVIVAIGAIGVLRRSNDFMRGASTPQISAILTLLNFGLLIAIWIIGGWQYFVIAFVIWIFIFRPIAHVVGVYLALWIHRRMSEGPFEKWVGIPDNRFAKLLEARQRLRNRGMEDVGAWLQASKESERLRDAAMDLALGQPCVQRVLNQYGASRETVNDSFLTLVNAGAGQSVMGHQLPECIAFYPRPLSVLLAQRSGAIEMSVSELVTAMLDYFRSGRALPKVVGRR